MIQTVLNGMITMLLAKFIVNDLPHAVGLTGPNVRIDTNEEVTQDKVQGAAIAWINDTDVGSLHYDLRINDFGELSFMQIDREYRGLGIGEKMYRAVENLARKHGVKEIILEVGIPGYGDIEEAKKFWRRMGFTVEDSSAHKSLPANPGTVTDGSWDNVWKSCVQAAKILGKELTEQDIPANWPELRRLHKDLWAQVYGRAKPAKSNPHSLRLERTTTDKILDDLERTWHRIESDMSTEMQSALSILKEVMGHYYGDPCVIVWNNGDLVGIAVYTTFHHADFELQFTHINELASFIHEPGAGTMLVKGVIEVAREQGSDVVSLYHGPGAERFYERLGFGRDYVTSYEPTAMTYLIKAEKENPGAINGICYEDAWRFLIKQDEGFLIHGSVQLSAEAPRINHAWVELTTGWVWEPQTKSYYTVEDFKIMSPTEEVRYTVEEAAIMVTRTGNMGPWTDDERSEYIGR